MNTHDLDISTAATAERRAETPHGPVDVVSDTVNDACRWLCTAFMAALVLAMFVGVVYRYLLNDALAWTGEAAGLATGWLVFLGTAALYRRSGHPAVLVVLDRLGERRRRQVTFVREIFVGAYLGLLFLSGVGVTFASNPPRTIALHISYAYLYAAIPVAAAVMLLHWFAGLLRERPGGTAALAVVAAAAVDALLIWLTRGAPDGLYAVPLAVLWALLPVMFLLGVPIAVVLGMFSMTVLAFSGVIPLSIAAERIYAGIDDPSFVAIPTLMLTGALMLRTGMSEKLVGFASAIVGRLRGGLALADVVASVLFADISGSAVADTAAIGSVMMPEMRRRGYAAGFVTAHQAAAGALGTLFPPSISMIIFATVTSVSVTSLFLGSLVPGIVLGLLFMVLAYVVALRKGYPREAPLSARRFGRATVGAVPAGVAVVVVLGGILGGIFTPSEAGSIAAVYVLLVGCNRLRHKGLRSVLGAFADAAETTAMVMFIIANAAVMAWMMISLRIPQSAVTTIKSLTTDRLVLVALICLLLIALAVFLEPPAILIAVVPIVLPVVTVAGVDAVHFGVLVMLTTTIGMLLPPVGISLLVAVGIAETPLGTAAKAVIPYVLTALVVLALVVLFPNTVDLLSNLVD